MKTQKIIWETIIVIFLTCFVALLNVSKVIIGAFQTTKDATYLAVGYYFYDYFQYIQYIVQGMRGHWLVENPFDPYDKSKTFIAFGQYLLIGKLANIFRWSPYFAYWLTLFVLMIILSLLIFYLIKRLIPNEKFFIQISAWLLSLFAAPFIKVIYVNNHLQIIPYEYWYAPMSIFHRFGVLPHHLTSSILIILILLLTDRIISHLGNLNWLWIFKNTLVVSLLLVFMLTFAPFQVINLMSSFMIVGWIYFNLYLLKNNKQSVYKLIIFLGLTLIIIFPSAIFTKISLQSIDSFKRGSIWEIALQNYPRFWEFFAVTGPILIFVPFGIRAFFESKIPLKFLFFFYTFFSYLYFYSPLAAFFGSHNGRFVNSIVYVLFGVLTILGIKEVVSRLTKKPVLLTNILIALLLGYFIIVTSVIYKSLPGVDAFSYLPKELITGIKILDRQSDKKVVLTSPMLSLGMIVPIIVDRKVYLGRSFSTPDFENKTVIVDQFYAGIMTKEQAEQLVIANNIGYVILSSLETQQFYNYKASILEAYPFLKKIYENKEVIIYKVL